MEEEIIQRCKDGELRAFEEIFEIYGKKLFGLCLRMSGHRTDAEDLMQEVFVILLSKIKAFRGESRFSTWLYRVTVNTCISHIRKQKVGSVSLDSVVDSSPDLVVNPNPIMQRSMLKRAILTLPAGYKTAVILHDIQGFNHREIADIMGITVGASKSQLFKARRKLRELINLPEMSADRRQATKAR